MRLFRFIFTTVVILTLSFNNCTSQSVKRGLIIGIGKYSPGSGWQALSSAKDIPLIKSTLINQGFQEKDIIILTDEKATKQNIINELDKLLSECNEGDIVVIHYSGHGQRIQDDNGDETDMLDEALIPYDAGCCYSDKYKGENHLRDDLIGEYVMKLRLKLKKQGCLNFFVDACYSATILKGDLPAALGIVPVIRGTEDIFGTPAFKEKLVYKNYDREKSGIYKSVVNLESKEGQNVLSSFILFTAAKHNQVCYEINPSGEAGGELAGPLSYSINKVFSGITGKETYRQLFEKIYSLITKLTNDWQQPQAEGDLNNVIFSSKVLVPEHYFTITENDGKGNITINGGELNGVFKNSIIAFYPEGTLNRESSEPLFNGTVINSDFFSSVIFAESLTSFTADSVNQMRLFIEEQGVPRNKLNIHLSGLQDEFRSELEQSLSGIQYIKISDSIPDFIISGINPDNNSGKEKIYLNLPNNSENITVYDASSSDLYAKLSDKLRYLYIAKQIKEIELYDKRYGAQIDVYSVRKIPDKDGYNIIPITSPTESGQIKQGDTLKFVIKNTGLNYSYVTLMLMKPNYKIAQYLPTKENEFNPSATLLAPGESYEQYIRFEYAGLVFCKVYMTKMFVNLRNIVNESVADNEPDSLKITNPDKSFEKSDIEFLLSLDKNVLHDFTGGSSSKLILMVSKN
ncbi:MAG: caspase family protein [Ignavibacteria bacterium]|nr:caspase family protein [Ignavibacteria bacterium]